MNRDEGETPLVFLDIKDEPEAYERLRTLLLDAPTRIHSVPALTLEALSLAAYRDAFVEPRALTQDLFEQAVREMGLAHLRHEETLIKKAKLEASLKFPPIFFGTHPPVRPEKKRSLDERKARRAKRKQRRQR